MILKSLREMAASVRNGEISPEDLVFPWTEKVKAISPRLNTHACFDEEHVTRELARVRRQLKSPGQERLKLAGIPVLIKDNIAVEGLPMTCGSEMLKEFHPCYDATAVVRLKEAGAVIFGKANMDEFAMGSSNEHSCHGPVKNPWNEERVPGGSSGGSAAAVAAGLAPAALGSDTGGSVRQPAGFCGVTGYKPSYGYISRYGLTAYGSSLDQIGFLTRSVEDAATILEVTGGFDPKDSTSLKDTPVNGLSEGLRAGPEALKGKKIGIISEFMSNSLNPDVRSAVEGAMKVLEKEGARIVEMSLPTLRFSIASYYLIAMAEASANLARFDGVRYGHRSNCGETNLTGLYCKSRSEGFGQEVLQRIMLGTFILSAGYATKYYQKATKARELIVRDVAKAREKVDLLMGPTSPTTAFRLGEKTEDTLSMYLSDICTIPANLVRGCGLSLPAGLSRDGLPVGFQLMGKQGDDPELLKVAHGIQSVTDWHLKSAEVS